MNQTTYLPGELQELERAANQAIDRAVAVLIDPNDQVRRAMVQHFMKLSHEIVRHKLLDRLIDLTAAVEEEVRRRAAESLVDAGAYAVATLVYRLSKARKPDAQLRLAEIIARAGRHLSPQEVMVFRPVLEQVRRKTRREEVRIAVAMAVEELGLPETFASRAGAGGVTGNRPTR